MDPGGVVTPPQWTAIFKEIVPVSHHLLTHVVPNCVTDFLLSNTKYILKNVLVVFAFTFKLNGNKGL